MAAWYSATEDRAYGPLTWPASLEILYVVAGVTPSRSSTNPPRNEDDQSRRNLGIDPGCDQRLAEVLVFEVGLRCSDPHQLDQLGFEGTRQEF